MADFSTFNDSRPAPQAPVPIPIRNVIQDLTSGRIDTNLRFGRKNQWKLPQRDRYVSRLLEGKFHPDPISISRRVVNGRDSDRAINGNNRLRSVRAFVANEFGVTNQGTDGKTHTYYYSEIPEAELSRPSRRALVHVIPVGVRNKFDNYPLLFNIREGLTEKEEITWYKELNVNVMPHKTGHLLIADMCDTENPIINALLSTFPIMKHHVGELETTSDAFSLGTYLLELSDATFDPLDERDTDENLMLSLTTLFNLLMNGNMFDKEFVGEFKQHVLTENIRIARRIFEEAHLSEELKDKFKEGTPRKAYIPLFWNTPFLLGPLFWSVATHGASVVPVWVQFLNSAGANTIGDVYYNDRKKTQSTDTTRMEELYNKVYAHVTQNKASSTA
jgi:hypothetical protein